MAPSAITIIERYPQLSLKAIAPAEDKLAITAVDRHGYQDGKHMIADALKKRLGDIDQDTCEPGEEDAFFVADMGEIYRQHLRWKLNLKRVKPHYGESRVHSADIHSLMNL